MSRPLSPWQAIFLGFVVLAGLGLGGFAVFQIGDRQRLWSPALTVRVGFPQVPGVGPGTPVRVRGLEAGQVVEVELPDEATPDSPVTLCLRVDRKFSHLLFADATGRIVSDNMLGTRSLVLDPGTRTAGPLADGATIGSRPTVEITELLQKASEMLAEVRESQGTLTRLVKDDRAYREIVTLLKDSQDLVRKSSDAVGSLKQDADAIKRLPVVRNYVTDANALLVRPDLIKHRQVVTEAELFESGSAILTDTGRQRLDEVGTWLNGLKVKGSEVVVAVYGDPKNEKELPAAAAQTLSQKQADAVAAYLRDVHGVHKLGWIARRKVTGIGLGYNPPPVPEKDDIPSGRVEVVAFLPQT